MEKRIGERIAQCRHMDWAVLYMRLFAGGMMFFHNIGKIQDYNEIVDSYPSFAFAGSPAVFVIVSLVEVVLATLIIMGLWVRASAIVMAAGILGVLLWGAPGFGTLAFTWLFFWPCPAAGCTHSTRPFSLRNEKIERREQYYMACRSVC